MRVDDPARASLERSVDDLLAELSKIADEEDSKPIDRRRQSNDGHTKGSPTEEADDSSRWQKNLDRIIDSLKEALDAVADADISVPGAKAALSVLSILIQKAQVSSTCCHALCVI